MPCLEGRTAWPLLACLCKACCSGDISDQNWKREVGDCEVESKGMGADEGSRSGVEDEGGGGGEGGVGDGGDGGGSSESEEESTWVSQPLRVLTST